MPERNRDNEERKGRGAAAPVLDKLIGTTSRKGYGALAEELAAFAREVEESRKMVRIIDKADEEHPELRPETDMTDFVDLNFIARRLGSTSNILKRQFGDSVRDWLERSFEEHDAPVFLFRMACTVDEPSIVRAFVDAALYTLDRAYEKGFGGDTTFKLVLEQMFSNPNFGPKDRKAINDKWDRLSARALRKFEEEEKKNRKEKGTDGPDPQY